MSNEKKVDFINAVEEAINGKKSAKKTPDTFGVKDKVTVTYQTKWYNLVNVSAVIIDADRKGGFPFKLKLVQDDGKPINLGHNDDGGQPGSGNIMYLKQESLTLVEKYVPKRLDGEVKKNWRVGDTFMPKKGFSLDQDDTDDESGVTQEMVDMAEKSMKIATIVCYDKMTWLQDDYNNFVWLAEWIDAVE